VRDQIDAIEQTLERQRVARAAGDREQDVFGFACRTERRSSTCSRCEKGRSPDARPLAPLAARAHRGLNAFLGQYYHADRAPPLEVLLPFEVEDSEILAAILSERRGARVEVKASVARRSLPALELARKNAELALETGSERKLATEPCSRRSARRSRCASAADDRVLRHLHDPGSRDGRLARPVRGRRAGEVALPEVQDQDGDGQDDFAEAVRLVPPASEVLPSGEPRA